MYWLAMHPKATLDHLGFIPTFLSEDDPRPAAKQFDANYVGGWHPFEGFTMLANGNLQYPDDPECLLLFETRLRDETIRVYQHAWVAIIQKDGSHEIARLD